MSDYITNRIIDVDLSEEFDELDKNSQVEFLKEKIKKLDKDLQGEIINDVINGNGIPNDKVVDIINTAFDYLNNPYKFKVIENISEYSLP